MQVYLIGGDAERKRELGRQLKRGGFGVSAAADPDDVSESAIAASDARAVLIDLPEDGAETLLELGRAIALSRGIPVVFSSDAAGAARVAPSKMTGTAGFLVRPVHEEQLWATLRLAI